MRWAEIAVAIASESAEAASAALRDAGCQGVAETLGQGTVVGYLPASEGVQAAVECLKDRLSNLPAYGLPAGLDRVLVGREYERLPAHHETYVYWSMIIVMTRRLARQPAEAKPQPA